MLNNIKIGVKILCMVLLVSLSTLIIISLISYTEMLNLTKYSQDANIRLGDTASEKSRTALLDQAKDYLDRLVNEKAASTNAVLERINAEVNSMAAFVEFLNAQEAPSAVNAVPPPRDPQQKAVSASYTIAPGAARTTALNEELRRLSSGEYMYSVIMKNNRALDSTYLGTESGIAYRYSTSDAPYIPGYDPRTRGWYTAAMAEPDSAVWLDTYLDSFGDVCITCAKTYRDARGRLAGVVAIDVFLPSIIADILDLRVGKSGYAFLLDRKGAYIAHPWYGFNTEPPVKAEGSLQRAIEAMLAGDHRAYEVEDDEGKRYLLSAPLFETGWTLCLSVPVEEVVTPANETKAEISVITEETQTVIRKSLTGVLVQFIIIFMFSALFVVVLSYVFSNSITRPIEELAENVRLVGQGELDTRITVNGKDEIAELGTAFNRMTADIKDHIKNISRINAEKERINSELSIASEIQNDMLPRIFPAFSHRDCFSAFAKMSPAKEVGGDFYDFFYLDDKKTKIAFIIADVSGKGVPAALFMVVAKTLLKQQMLQSHDPAASLFIVNEILCENNPRCMFVTVFAMIIDLANGEVLYANAGHNPPLLSQSGGPFQFMPLETGIPLGVMEQWSYHLCSLRLNPGDKFYLYTDGINEAMNREDEQFGNERFINKANQMRELATEEFDNEMRRTVTEFTDGAEQSDDITTLCFHYT